MKESFLVQHYSCDIPVGEPGRLTLVADPVGDSVDSETDTAAIAKFVYIQPITQSISLAEHHNDELCL